MYPMISSSNHRLRVLTLLLTLGLICTVQSKASVPELPEIQSFLNNNFDLKSQNWSISQQEENKYIYLANSDGLIEFNGISWKKYTLRETRPLRAVLAHKDGKIYTGSFEDFGYWERNSEGELVYFSLAAEGVIENNDEIWKIYNHDEGVYFQSFTTIYLYKDGTIQKFIAPYTMLFLHQVRDKFVAQIIDNGLYWFRNDEYIPIKNSEFLANVKVHAIIPYDEERWMICTDNAGLFLFDGTTFSYFGSEASEFLKSFTCNAAKQLSDTTFAFGSILNGLIITDESGNIRHSYNANNGLNNNTILSLFLDADMGLWAGLDEGINYINLISPFSHYKTRNGTLGTIYALLRKDDYLYIGTNHGLFRADIIERGGIFSFQNLVFIPGSHGQVWTLEEIDGQIICGHNEGTFLVKNNSIQLISSVTGGWAYVPLAANVIGGTYTGIIVFEKDQRGNWQFRNKVENFNEPTRYLETDYLGYLWASHHQKGLFKIELSDDLLTAVKVEHIREINNRALNIKVFKINNRVVFATGENIYTWDFVRNEIIPFETLNIHLGEYIKTSQISHFKRNQYWFINDDKLALFDINLEFSAELIMEIQQENVYLPQRRLQLVNIDENTILRPNHQNFDAINIQLAEKEKPISRLTIEKLYFYGNNRYMVWLSEAPTRKIPSGINNLTVYFADPSDFSQHPKTYQFRIKELDQAWQTTTSNHFTYLDLKHGKYTIEIAREGETLVQIQFTVGKPWFISTAAVIAYILAFMALVWGLWEFFRFEIKRQKDLAAMEIRQSHLEKELDYKSYELLLTMRHLLMKDNILNDLQKQIDILREQSAKYPVKHINSMEKIINQGLGTQSVEWENAMNNLKLSQQGFFRSLKEKYPQLTTNDLRLCSYLRMNFNTKEIAQLLNISARGVEVSRHRLRKKLNLDHDDNLVEFLMSEELNLTE
jgi:DNA-binding CsgD family transcriptional regulator